MNDLAEQALRGLAAARRKIVARPMPGFGVLGFGVSTVVVLAGGQVGAAQATRPLTSWLGIEKLRGVGSTSEAPGLVLLVALVVLALLWVGVVEVVRRTGRSETSVWATAAAWALPFVLGPPLMDTTVYTYVAFGRLQRGDHDPYSAAPTSLGDSAIVAAIDPGARGTLSSAGPLGSLLQHLAMSISGGGLLGAVLVFRVLGLAAAVWICRSVADLAGPSRATALSLCALNPLLLLYVISSPHLEGAMLALALAAVLAAVRRRWVPAIVMASVAGSITAQGFVAVVIIVAAHAMGRSATAARWRVLGRDVLVAAVVIAAAGFVQPDGFGWRRTFDDQFGQHTSYSVAGAISGLLTPIVRGASFDDLAAGGRLTAVIAAACVLIYLVVTVRLRPLDVGVGSGLLALALLAPALHPWYLMWGVLGLTASAHGPRRNWVLALSLAGCVLSPPGLTDLEAKLATGVGLALVAGWIAAVSYAGRERLRDPAALGERLTGPATQR